MACIRAFYSWLRDAFEYFSAGALGAPDGGVGIQGCVDSLAQTPALNYGKIVWEGATTCFRARDFSSVMVANSLVPRRWGRCQRLLVKCLQDATGKRFDSWVLGHSAIQNSVGASNL